ncbi:MAG TPA: SH3 domain-containing protein [Stellaceae bacterium]|nr:SH3 domain-containing protein [Stellaceae bacterium]
MRKIALATAVALLAAASLAVARAEVAPPAGGVLPPGAAPPWADATTSTETAKTTENLPAAAQDKVPAPTRAAVPAPVAAAEPPQPAVPDAARSDAASATPMPTPAPVPMQGTTTPIHPVSLRAGPTGSAPIIGTLRPGDQLEILGTANYGWTEVRSSAGTGWAYGSYLAPGGIGRPPPAPSVIVHP